MCVNMCINVEYNVPVFAVLLLVAFSALVATIWCIGACRCQRGLIRSRVESWKPLPSDNIPLGTEGTEGSKPLLTGDEEEDDMA